MLRCKRREIFQHFGDNDVNRHTGAVQIRLLLLLLFGLVGTEVVSNLFLRKAFQAQNVLKSATAGHSTQTSAEKLRF